MFAAGAKVTTDSGDTHVVHFHGEESDFGKRVLRHVLARGMLTRRKGISDTHASVAF